MEPEVTVYDSKNWSKNNLFLNKALSIMMRSELEVKDVKGRKIGL